MMTDLSSTIVLDFRLEMSEIPLKENADSKDKTGPTEVVGFISLVECLSWLN